MVTSKAGREFNHAHSDIGQVVIDGHGEPLIIDIGSCPYPSAELWDQREKFYNFSGFSHNIPLIADRNLLNTAEAQGKIVEARFDRDTGATWHLDSTAAYPSASSVTRTVIHLFPGIVGILDRIELNEAQKVTLRWHTVDRCSPDANGTFLVQGNRAMVSGRVVRLETKDLRIHRGQHAYRAPYDRNRLGDLQVQKHESFIETEATGLRVDLLSLFSVIGPGEEPFVWQGAKPGVWTIETARGPVQVDTTRNRFSARNLNTGGSLAVQAVTPPNTAP